MANNSAADGHQQSIGADSTAPVDGIAGSHAGTQEPSGAHVDAGGPIAGATRRPEAEPEVKHQGNAQKSVGMNGRGVAQPAGAVGMTGWPRDDGDTAPTVVFQQQRSKAVSPSRQHSSGK